MPEASSKSGGMSPATIFFFILAFFGIGAPMIFSTLHSNPSPAISAGKDTVAADDEDSAEGLLEEFFDANPNQFIDTNRPWQQNPPIYPKPESSWSKGDPRSHDRISFLIATLPDPTNPSLRYEFDRYIDSIQRAFSHEYYLLDKSYIPWAGQPVTKPESNDNTGETLELRRPGVMLFRRHDIGIDSEGDKHLERDSLMVVFLVGETPTDGVDATALRSALDQIAWLRGWTGPSVSAHGKAHYRRLVARRSRAGGDGDTSAPPHYLLQLTQDKRDDQYDVRMIPNQIKIIGPTYSGSATSIQEVLRSWLKFGKLTELAPPVTISLLSGTVTAIDSWPPELGDFSSTELPENQIFPGIVDFFSKTLMHPRIAILTDDTGYGDAIGKSYGHSFSDWYSGKITVRPYPITVLPYPIHISNVRTALADSPQQAAPAATPLGFEHRDLSISDEDPGHDHYLVQSFSHASAADDEVVLADLLSTIHQENFHYVGIVATNIQDAIFLIREIRENCPDTIPFLTSSDLLYLHSDFNRDLAGTLIFSTYPLFASNQLWTWPSNYDSRRFQFPSGAAEGVYNAALAALDDPMQMVDYALPFSGASKEPQLWVSAEPPLLSVNQYPTLSVSEDPPPFVREGPSLWVSIVGDKAIWPVSIYPINQQSDIVFSRLSQPGTAEFLPHDFGLTLYPREFIVTFLLVILLCTLPQFYLSGLDRFFQGTIRRPPRWLARVVGDSALANRANPHLRLSLSIVLLTFFVVASAVWLLPLHAMTLWTEPSPFSCWLGPVDRQRNSSLFAWTTLAPTLLAVLCIILGLIGFIRTPSNHANHNYDRTSGRSTFGLLFRKASWTATLRLAPSIIAMFMALWFVRSIWRQDPLQALLYFVRAANLWNGVSPLLPLLYIGIAALWLSASELWRLGLAEEYVLTNSFLGFGEDGSFAGIGAYGSTTAFLLKCSITELPFWWLWGLLVLVIYFLLDLPGYKLVALDGQPFNLFFILIAIYVYISLLLLFGRFIAVWFELRSLLRRLSMHPTRRAYEELRTSIVPPSMADRQRVSLVEPPNSVTPIEFCLERVREILRQVEPSTNDRETTIARRVNVNRSTLSALVEINEQLLDRVLRYEADGDWQTAIKWKSRLQIHMSELSGQITKIFEPWWRLDHKALLTARPAPGQPAANRPAADQASLDESLVKHAELFVASRVVDFLRQVFPQMMNLVVYASVGLLALVLAASSYPFPQRDTISWFSWIILLSVIGVTIAIFIQINRDRVVSMLSDTTPGELNWNSSFIWQLVVFGLIPIFTLLGAQFPHGLQGIFSSFGGLFGSGH